MSQSDLNEHFFETLNQLIKKFNLLDRDEKVCYGLTMSQCHTVETLGKQSSITMNELSQQLGVAVSTMTRICDVLVRDGIVDRQADPGDRRCVCIALTDKGQGIAGQLKQCSRTYTQLILERIPEEKRERVIESLQLLEEAIQTTQKQCCNR